jgi:hypothetical protein
VGRIRAPRDVGVTGAGLDRLIARQRDYFQARGEGVEWKVRARDRPADLAERLAAAGFVPEVLVGFAEEVAAEPSCPAASCCGGSAKPRICAAFADHQTEVMGYDCSWVAADLGARVVLGRGSEAAGGNGGDRPRRPAFGRQAALSGRARTRSARSLARSTFASARIRAARPSPSRRMPSMRCSGAM